MDTDREIVEHITDIIMNDPWIQDATNKYVRAIQGRSMDEDVSDSDAYWDAYTTRLMKMTLRAVTTWHNAPTQEEVVF